MLFGHVATDKLCNLIYVLSEIQSVPVGWFALDIAQRIIKQTPISELLKSVQSQIIESYDKVIITREMCTGCETIVSRLPQEAPCLDFDDYKEFLTDKLKSDSSIVFPLLLKKGILVVDGKSMDEFLKQFNIHKE